MASLPRLSNAPLIYSTYGIAPYEPSRKWKSSETIKSRPPPPPKPVHLTKSQASSSATLSENCTSAFSFPNLDPKQSAQDSEIVGRKRKKKKGKGSGKTHKHSHTSDEKIDHPSTLAAIKAEPFEDRNCVGRGDKLARRKQERKQVKGDSRAHEDGGGIEFDAIAPWMESCELVGVLTALHTKTVLLLDSNDATSGSSMRESLSGKERERLMVGLSEKVPAAANSATRSLSHSAANSNETLVDAEPAFVCKYLSDEKKMRPETAVARERNYRAFLASRAEQGQYRPSTAHEQEAFQAFLARLPDSVSSTPRVRSGGVQSTSRPPTSPIRQGKLFRGASPRLSSRPTGPLIRVDGIATPPSASITKPRPNQTGNPRKLTILPRVPQPKKRSTAVSPTTKQRAAGYTQRNRFSYRPSTTPFPLRPEHGPTAIPRTSTASAPRKIPRVFTPPYAATTRPSAVAAGEPKPPLPHLVAQYMNRKRTSMRHRVTHGIPRCSAPGTPAAGSRVATPAAALKALPEVLPAVTKKPLQARSRSEGMGGADTSWGAFQECLALAKVGKEKGEGVDPADLVNQLWDHFEKNRE